jgi:hypothetical protein
MTKTQANPWLQLYWRDKRNPDASGEGATLKNEDKAYKICQMNNRLFPNFHHWYEVADKDEQTSKPTNQ